LKRLKLLLIVAENRWEKSGAKFQTLKKFRCHKHILNFHGKKRNRSKKLTETLAKTMFISGARGALKSVKVRQNLSSLTEAIQIAVQMEQKWIKVKLAKQRIQELADMEDHELEHSQWLEPQIIHQVN
jgi:hypothetical protein